MRKISRSRAEDDVVSSTNGSVANEEQAEAERQADPEEKEPESDSNENADSNEHESTSTSIKETPSKKGKAKSKAKKRKSGKDKSASEEEEYEVEKIIDSKKIKGKLHYLIRWKGYSAKSDTWEPENTLSCPELINKFNDEQKENSKSKESTPAKKNNKRKAKKDTGSSPSKRPKTDWDSKDADENAEYEVDRILEVRIKKNGKREFFIHWKGWSNKYDSWEPESNLNCSELINKFMEKVSKARSVEARDLRVAPVTTNRYTLQDPTHGRRLSKRRGQRQRVRYDDAE